MCTELDATGANNRILFDVNPNRAGAEATIISLDANGQQINCSYECHLEGDASGTKAAELLSAMELERPSATAVGHDAFNICRSTSLVGFVRANNTVTSSTQDSHQNISTISMSSLWMSCRPRLLTAPYSVTVSSSGHILSTTPLAPYVTDFNISTYFINDNRDATPTTLYQCMNTLINPERGSYWHNDTFAITWFTYLMKSLSNNTIFLDAYAPVPSSSPPPSASQRSTFASPQLFSASTSTPSSCPHRHPLAYPAQLSYPPAAYSCHPSGPLLASPCWRFTS